MNDMENMRVFADQLWKYMVPKLKSMFASNVSYFRAKVVSNPGNNTLEVRRPVENGTLTLPCTAAMSGATTGQQVTVLVMGNLSNAIVVGDGKMNGELGALPIERGGTGETTALAALTALGGLSAKDFGVSLYSNANINTLLTPGAYRCSTGAIAATITGTPTTGSGFRLFAMVGHNANTFVHIADIGSRLLIRSTTDQGATWTDWEGFSMDGHTHDYLPLAGGTLTGDLMIQLNTGIPSFSLRASEKEGVGRARMMLYKEAGSTDYGTWLIDYTWDNSLKTALVLRNAAAALRDRLTLRNYTGSTSTTYHLFGEHNPPAVADVAGLQTELNNRLSLSGGTLSGNLTIQRDAGTSSLILDSPEKTDVGRARTQLQKNASATSDNGTYLVDYVWGGGSSSTQRVILRLQASTSQLRDRLRLLDYPDGASGTTYRLYGEHNKPAIADITGLEARLADIEGRLTALENN